MSAIARAIDVLKAFSPQHPELTLAEIAASTTLGKATTLRLLKALCDGGLLFKNPTTLRYRLAFEFLRLAEIAKAPIDLLSVARPFMRIARDRLQETALIAVRNGDYRINIEQLESPQPVRRVVAIGEQIPLYVSATGKILIAAMSDADIAAYAARVPLQPFSQSTVADAKALWDAVQSARTHGYSVAYNEGGTDGAAVSAGILNASGETIGALSVTVPISRFNDDLKARMIETVMECAAGVSRGMGYSA